MRITKQPGTAQGILTGAMALCLALAAALPAPAQDVTDMDITSAINTELWGDNAVSANSIDVTTADGVVTLEGTVNNILAKDRAQALAEATVGVRAIVNLIKVIPDKPRGDKELATAVEDAWLADPATDSYELSASARNGVVTVSGAVQSYAERDLSETVAKGVPGVKGIKNEIKVDYKGKRSDAEIEVEIAARLENDVRVDDGLVQVDVQDGKVMLSGTVGSLQEKTQAGSDAWVAGVKTVDTDDLEVKWWARDEMKRTSTFIGRTDEEIEQAVKDAFLYDPRVTSFTPRVQASFGTVTLSGIVDNLEAKRAAGQAARNTLGVWRVRNQLKVRTEIPSNEDLETDVAMALRNDLYVDRYDVTVDAYSGWVYLSGKVNTSFEKNRSERAAEGVKGVVGVVNNIAYDYQWTWKPDRQIREDAREQLQWSAFVNDDNIRISVENGVVTLSGTVDSWSQWDEAEKNAYQAGAKNVINSLVADYRYYGPRGPE